MQTENRVHIVDRESPIPIYHQIASDVMNRISLGEWKIGDKLPSEAVLQVEYQVSLITLRQALKYLEEARLIEKHQGKGTFLRDTPKPFVEDLALPGTPAKSSDVLTTSKIVKWQRDVLPSLYIQQTFDVDTSGSFLFLQRVFLRENKPFGLNDVWLPEALVPGIMDEELINGSISTTLHRRYGYQITSVSNFIESAKLDAADALLLDAPYDAPVLRICSAHQDASGQVLEYSCTSWLGNLTRLHISVDVK